MNAITFAGRHLRTYSVQTHSHEEWELIYCTSGRGQVEFENATIMAYQVGEVVAIPPNVRHSNHSIEGFTNIHLIVENATFPYKNAVKVSDDADSHILSFFSEAHFYFNSDIGKKEMILSALGELIVSYIILFQSQTAYSEPVELIRNDILKNYSDSAYHLDDYLRTLPFNYDYLRKLFKKEMGLTPHAYLTSMRMKKAEMLLKAMRANEYSIAEVADMCGFDEPLYFSRVFKKHFSCPPSAFAGEGKKVR